MTALATEAADLAAISKVYRFALGSRAMSHSMRGHPEMAAFLSAGAAVAGELAVQYSEAALFLASVRMEVA